MASTEDVRELALALPETSERPSYGTPGFRVKDRLFARLHQDGESLMLRCDRLQRVEMHAADPERFYWTPHYEDYDAVLVRIAAVDRDELRELLTMAWLFVAPARLAAALDAASR